MKLKDYRNLNSNIYFISNKPVSSEGMESNVYYLGRGLCGKILKNSPVCGKLISDINLVNLLIHEYLITENFYFNGISVPKPYGIFGVPSEKGEIFPTYVMEFIQAIPEGEWSEKDFNLIEKLYFIEEKKAVDLGYIPAIDSNPFHNTLFSFDKKLFLHDFTGWMKSDSQMF